MTENRDFKYIGEKGRKIKNLIKYILSIKRQKKIENSNETPEVKLGRRLEQRSFQKLSVEIIEHLITRYEIDYHNLPTEEQLVEMMINFLGSIQKTPNNYKLKNDESQISRLNTGKVIGTGFHGKVYSYELNSSQTKIRTKKLALKLTKEGKPYTIDIHITSAILLALYDFQPKYYNFYFMEIGNYDYKSKQRKFKHIQEDKKKLIEKNIKFYILYNFTNISDQVRNSMVRVLGNELIKIDIRRLNSERSHINIERYLDYFDNYKDIFLKHKTEVKNELDKILIVDEEFLIDLMIFRTERGCFNISNSELAIQVDCISTSYKVIKVLKNENTTLSSVLRKCKKVYKNLHCESNPALSWMLHMLLVNKVLEDREYNNYVDKFNKKSEVFEEIARRIRNDENFIINNRKKRVDNYFIFEQEEEKKEEKKEEEKEEKKEEKNGENKEEKKDESKNEKIIENKDEIKEEIEGEINDGEKQKNKEVKKEEKKDKVNNNIEEEIKEEIEGELNHEKNENNKKEIKKEIIKDKNINEEIEEEIKEEIEEEIEEEKKEEIKNGEIKWKIKDQKNFEFKKIIKEDIKEKNKKDKKEEIIKNNLNNKTKEENGKNIKQLNTTDNKGIDVFKKNNLEIKIEDYEKNKKLQIKNKNLNDKTEIKNVNIYTDEDNIFNNKNKINLKIESLDFEDINTRIKTKEIVTDKILDINKKDKNEIAYKNIKTENNTKKKILLVLLRK